MNLILDSQSKWCLSPEQVQELDHYYILSWSRNHFLTRISESVEIFREGVSYLVLTESNQSPFLIDTEQVLLSFRKLKSFSYGYVLVRPMLPLRLRSQIS